MYCIINSLANLVQIYTIYIYILVMRIRMWTLRGYLDDLVAARRQLVFTRFYFKEIS